MRHKKGTSQWAEEKHKIDFDPHSHGRTLTWCFCYPSLLFSLSRIVSRAEILGNSEVFIKSGNDINLTCVAYEAPGPPSFIYWYKGPSVINYSQRGGISVLTERHSKTSKLVISRAMASDSGNYTCLPSNSGEYMNLLTHSHSSAIMRSLTELLLLLSVYLLLFASWSVSNDEMNVS